VKNKINMKIFKQQQFNKEMAVQANKTTKQGGTGSHYHHNL